MIFNDGSQAMLVIPDGCKFVSGATPLVSREVDVPVVVYPIYGEHLLHSGQVALFEWNAGTVVDEWIKLYKNESGANFPSCRFLILSGSRDSEIHSVTISLDVRPLSNPMNLEDDWLIPENSRVIVDLSPPNRCYPTDYDRLRKQLTQ
jgi:hypothetical protein